MIKKVLLSLLCAAALTGSAFGAAYAAGGGTNSAVSPADLWTADDGVSVTANVAAPDYMTNGWETIGVRMPDDPFVLKLIEGCGVPMLVSSATEMEIPTARWSAFAT